MALFLGLLGPLWSSRAACRGRPYGDGDDDDTDESEQDVRTSDGVVDRRGDLWTACGVAAAIVKGRGGVQLCMVGLQPCRQQ